VEKFLTLKVEHLYLQHSGGVYSWTLFFGAGGYVMGNM